MIADATSAASGTPDGTVIAVLFVCFVGAALLEYITYGMCRILEERTIDLDDRLKAIEEERGNHR